MQYPPIITLPSNKTLLRAQGLLERVWANLLLPRIAAENVTANICWILNWNKCQQYMNLEMQRDRCSPTLNFIWIGDPKQLQCLYSLWGATAKEKAEAAFYYFATMPTFLLKSSPGENEVTNYTSNTPFSDWNPFLKKTISLDHFRHTKKLAHQLYCLKVPSTSHITEKKILQMQ